MALKTFAGLLSAFPEVATSNMTRTFFRCSFAHQSTRQPTRFSSTEACETTKGDAKPNAEWTAGSKRTGLLAVKLGMTQTWDEWGAKIPVTVLQIKDNHVVALRTQDKDGYSAVQVGAITEEKERRLTKARVGHCRTAGLPPKRHLCEFRVTEDALVPIGTELTCQHFVPGQYVDVTGTSIGKGFQGVMKRHGFAGMPASHGVTKTHRKMGASGGGQDPGRVWKGKKMEGRMGGQTVYMPSLQVHKIDTRWNLLYVKGSVPGAKQGIVKVADAQRRPHKTEPPFPTDFSKLSKEVKIAPKAEEDPLAMMY